MSKTGPWVQYKNCSFLHLAVPNIPKLQHDLQVAQEKIEELERKMVSKGKPELEASPSSNHDKVMLAVVQDPNLEPHPHQLAKIQTLETLINTLANKLDEQKLETQGYLSKPPS